MNAGFPLQQISTKLPHLSPSKYAKNNGLQRKHSNLVLAFSQPAFLVEPHDKMRILHVGCGTGDFTRDCLLPCCRPCEKVVGVDINPEMIEYARENSAHEKIDYQVLDIDSDVTEFLSCNGQFDRVYSFYCLQWLQDPGAALKNIASLLSPGGQCLLMFPATHKPATIWSRLAIMERWEKYSEILRKHIPKSHYMKDKEVQLAYMSALLREAQLSPSIFVLSRLVTFDGWSEHDIIEMHMGIVPINALVTNQERHQLLEDITTLVRKVHAPDCDKSLFWTYIIMATKPKS
ncbi:juvenile hormone acid O-methyltransferase-like isoform X1 [Rhipicephalus microplus]|uniref:juvenile hormone acid O-methyltransferase-like isoform X1 n=1 Tax=Rhipicephalus microplus TaxID=6941 RepID=UPI003F6DA0B7